MDLSRRQRRRQRAALLAVATALALAGCSSSKKGELGEPGFVHGFAGMAAAEDPQAVLVARDILGAGGSAADAVVAMSLTMAVTLPSAAGLGGGGACAAWSPKTNKTEVVDFMAGGGLPAIPRGLFALHAKYGRLRWETVVGPAESLARFGAPLSRALVSDAVAAGPVAGEAMPMLRSRQEGDRIEQPELAALLGKLRVRGAGDLYVGETARDLVKAINAVGGQITLEQLRAYTPTVGPGHSIPAGNDTAVATAPAVASAGGNASQADTVFVALDGDGGVAACAQTMGKPFGRGKMAPGTGMVVAELSGVAAPVAAVVANTHSKEPRGALGAVGGQAGSLVAAAVAAAGAGQSADAAIVPGNGMQAITCGSGRITETRCQVASDPQGHGLGMAFGKN